LIHIEKTRYKKEGLKKAAIQDKKPARKTTPRGQSFFYRHESSTLEGKKKSGWQPKHNDARNPTREQGRSRREGGKKSTSRRGGRDWTNIKKKG